MKKLSINLPTAMLATVLSMSLTSCETLSYQVYEVKSSDLIQRENSLVFENEDCKVSYNLWEYNGSMAFIFENKSEKDIFIDMSQTFFIKNGAAFDYYKDRTFESRSYGDVASGNFASTEYISSEGYWPNRYLIRVANNTKLGISSAVTTKEAEYVCIPAKSYKVINAFKIYPSFIKTCNETIDYPKKMTIVGEYEENSSPLKFKNRIAYSFEENNNSLKFIDNSFWLSSVKNYSQKEAIETKKEKDECRSSSSYTAYKKYRYFKIGGPNQFYVNLGR